MNILNKKIYEEIAKELNIPIYLVEKICKHPFKVTKQVMECGDLKNIMFPLFGKFVVKPGRLEKLIQNGKTLHIQDNKDTSKTSK